MFKIKSPSGFLLTILIITFTMFSCQKEKLDETYLLEEQTVEDLSATLKTNDSCKSKLISIQDEFEQTFYLSQNSKEIFQANFGVIDWDYKSLYCDFFNPDSLIIFPMVSLLNDQDIQSLLVVDKITRASEYSFTIIGKHQFSEVLDNINPESIPESVTQLFEFFNYFSSVDNAATTRCDPGEGCNFNGNWWQRFWGSVGGFFKQIIDGFGSGNSGGGGSNSSGSGNYDIGPYISPYSTTFWNNNPSTGGNNSGGGSSSNSEPTFCTSPSGISFQNIVPLLENLSQFANEFGVSNVDGIPLMDLLQPSCINVDYVEFRDCANKSIACHYGVDSKNYSYMRHFLNEYQLEDLSTLADVVGNCGTCSSQESYDEYALEQLAEYYSSLIDKENFDAEDSAFEYKTLSCESFIFSDQLDGSGQVACVDELFLSKVFANTGAFSYTDQFCVHVTMPKVRHDGIVVPSGRAQDCAAWAANEAAALVGFAFARSNYQMFDDVMIALFRTTFNVQIKKSSCGYGSMTTCDNPNVICPSGGPHPAEWIEGFFDFIEESLFGCF